MPDNAPSQPALTGYATLLCVTGGIAAYKAAMLASALVQDGCGVTVAMTRNARRFVGPITFEALTGRAVLTNMWRGSHPGRIEHLACSETADLIVVAPATANILAKLATGIGDDLVSTLLLGADSPVILAPAMNSRMWQHPATKRSITQLQADGHLFVGPDEGRQACRTVGTGRMSEPEKILAAIRAQLLSKPAKARK